MPARDSSSKPGLPGGFASGAGLPATGERRARPRPPGPAPPGVAFQRARVRFHSYLLVFFVAVVFLILSHGPLLDLPYYWDEMGQFIPAALDIFHHAAWIPVSTVPNVHPPALMAYLAAVWTVFGYSVEATRIAMLFVAALGALFAFLLAIELGRGSAGTPAFAAIALFCISPLFFAQAMLAQLDMPAMVAATLALLLFLQNRFRDSALACAALVLIKETGLIVPALFFVWLLFEKRGRQALWFLLPLPGLAAWLVVLHRATGYWLGNPAFAHYNLAGQLTFAHAALAFVRRCYYLFVGSGHFIGTGVLIYAFGRMPLLRDRAWKIAAAFVLAQAVALSLVGGAVLERYLLPTLPVLYTAFAVALQALTRDARRLATGALLACLALASFINPVYPFPYENNLAFTDFIDLERVAAAAVDGRPVLTVASAFPVADALRNPEFGYVEAAHKVVTLPDFAPATVSRLAANPPDLLIVFDRTWDPLGLLRLPALRNLLIRHYGYVPEMPPSEIAKALSMRVARRWTRRGLSMELLIR